MEQPPDTETQPEPAAPAPLSLGSRLLNIFASPGELFDYLKTSAPSVANWLVPILLFAFAGSTASCIIFSEPAFQQQLKEQQEKALDKQVQAGKLSQADADRAAAMLAKFNGPIGMILGSAGSVFVAIVHVVWWALILMLFAKWFFDSQVSYGKMLELAGLTQMISVLGAIVGLLLSLSLARMFASPSLALLVNNFSASNKGHVALGAVNAFYLWQLGVVAAGLARLTGGTFPKALAVVGGYWILQEAVFILTPMAQFAL